jgi:AcrR family transcriptional regulator
VLFSTTAIMNPTTSTRERILHQGLVLMSQAGLSGVTLGVLADQVGMSKSGLFAHFRSKEDVQVELLTDMSEFVMEHVVRPSMTVSEGLPRLRALVRNWFGWAQRAGLPGGCPVAAGLFEFDDIEGRVRNKILELEGAFRRALVELVQRSVELGNLRHDLDIEQFVWELRGIYLGHHTAHRFLRTADADSRAQRAFRTLLARATAASTGSKVATLASSRQNKTKAEKNQNRRRRS